LNICYFEKAFLISCIIFEGNRIQELVDQADFEEINVCTYSNMSRIITRGFNRQLEMVTPQQSMLKIVQLLK
jgi:hypothetical protein